MRILPIGRYVVFFRGLNAQIDRAGSESLAENRGAKARFYRHDQVKEAAGYVAMHPDEPYHVVGFSRGGAPDVMGGFMRIVRAKNWRLPEDIMTVGLYSGTRRYADPIYECINFLDCSGRKHVGEYNAYDLGADVKHLGPDSVMTVVAKLFARGRTLEMIVGRPVGNTVVENAQ